MSMCSCAINVTIYSAGGKFWQVSKFTELHALMQATCSYALLYHKMIYKLTQLPNTVWLKWYKLFDKI